VEKVELRCETEDWVEEMKTCGCPHNLYVFLTFLAYNAGHFLSPALLREMCLTDLPNSHLSQGAIFDPWQKVYYVPVARNCVFSTIDISVGRVR
jgi:hypothetical protein